MKQRTEAARLIERMMHDYRYDVPPIPDKRLRNREIVANKAPWHFGLVELRHLLDFIYEGPPNPGEEIHKRRGWKLP